MVVLRGRLAPEVGALLLRALDAARETLYQRTRGGATPPATDPAMAPPTRAQQQADALALLAETALHHELDPGAPGERYQVVVHVDAAVLADPEQPGQSVLEEGSHVSAETSRRLACDASRVVMRHDEEGRVVEIGARTRTIPPGAAAGAAPSGPELSLPGLPRAGRTGPSRAPLGAGRPDRRSATSSCCAAGITARYTRRDTGSRENPTARSSSGGRMAGRYPRCRRRSRCPRIRFIRCARSTPPRDCSSTRGPARPAWLGERLDVGWALDVLHPRAVGPPTC